MKYIFITLIAVLLKSNISYAHGEEKPGPHGGHIRMPGAFHTEVVTEKEGFKIYLLDINWKNPLIEKSNVKANIKNKKTAILNCSKEKDFFFCKTKNTTQGSLIVQATRDNHLGEEVTYTLPLKFEKESVNTAPMDHSKHH